MDTRGALELRPGSYPIPTVGGRAEVEALGRLRQQLDVEDRVREYRRQAGLGSPRGRMFPPIGGGAFYVTQPIPPFNSAIGANFNTFTTLKDVSPTPLPNVSNLRPESGIELIAHGEFSTTATPTLQFAVIYGAVAGAAGGVNLSASGAITTGTATAWPWMLYYNGVVTAIGSAGSITGQGYLFLGTSLTAFAISAMPVTAAARTVAIDTTVAKLLGVGAAWSASSASNNVRVYNVAALLLN